MAPGQIHAQVETSKEPVAIAMEEKVSKEAEAPVEEKVQAAPASVETSLAGEEVQEGPKAEDLVEEKSQDEAKVETVTEPVVKDAEEPAAPAEESLAPEENIVALELAKLADPEAQKASESIQAKDISNDIINPRVSIRTENTTTPKTLDAGLGEQLTWGVSFTTPEGTKEGDTFTVKLSDNMSLKGIEPDTDYALPVKFGDKIIANAKRIDKQTIQYTFTKEINDLKYARVYIINSAQENREKVQETSDQTFKINIGEKAKDEQKIKVDFGKIYEAELSSDVNGKSQFIAYNPKTGEFTQVFYLNPESKEITPSTTDDQNGRQMGKVGFLLSSPHDADKPRSVDYLANNTKIEVKKLPKGAKLPDAIIENPEGAQPATNVKGEFRNFKGEPMFTMNFGNGNKIDSPYVVVVKGHANEIDGKYTELYSNGTLYGDGEASLFLDNSYTVQENSTASEGEKETLGYFKEHHIYILKKMEKKQADLKFQEQLYQVQLTNTITQTKMKYQDITL
ncbi:C-terminal domain protein of bacterial fibrinogen-binding adhesin [Peptoniphilus sp. oral taxon 375 str. F0436]|nr:C-terminal domain protein of bacterial fibrinogen-binding adhesin [Peptoniphilus sp. oral taxon 375 str. F0436]